MRVVKGVTGMIVFPQFQDVVYSSFPYSKLTLSFYWEVLNQLGCEAKFYRNDAKRQLMRELTSNISQKGVFL
ncbi:MAG: hypothetical protein ACM3TR_10415 [Caulobacteraceae bacterium]